MASTRTKLTALWILGGLLAVIGIGIGVSRQPALTDSSDGSAGALDSAKPDGDESDEAIPNAGRDYLRDVEPGVDNLSQLAHDASRLARDYIVRETSKQGRFSYIKFVDNDKSTRKYNVLRHAGTLYALGMLSERDLLDEDAKAALLRAAQYLRTNYIGPVEGHPELLAVFSKKGEEKSISKTPEAKLGGSGLALVGLLAARQHDAAGVPLDELQKLARFILFMMQDDGSFHSKWSADRQFDYDFKSLYYPGEAILGLVELYRVDGNREWLNAAAKAAGRLVISRRGDRKLPPDHWLLLASSALIPLYGEVSSPLVEEQELYAHVVEIADQMIASQKRLLDDDDPILSGAFDSGASSTGAATRLEGMVALYDLAGKRGDTAVQDRLRPAIVRGGEFVLRSQVNAGPMQGAIVRNARINGKAKRSDRRQREVRIDYVQHAMSALLGIARICENGC